MTRQDMGVVTVGLVAVGVVTVVGGGYYNNHN